MSGAAQPAPQKPVFAIFEGGGAKGIAHIGGLAAAEEARLAFVGVAGASAGAMVAALVAAGYRAHQLLRDTDADDNLLSRLQLDPVGMLGRQPWQEMQYLRGGAGWLARCVRMVGGLGILRRALRAYGHFDTAPVREFINRALQLRLRDMHGERGVPDHPVPARVTFADLDYETYPRILLPLKIIATDVDAGRAVLFDRVRTPQVEVGEAVAASVAIPGVFRPAAVESYTTDADGRDVRGHRFADGGLIANLPVHVFLEEKQAFERRNPEFGRVPILGFSLVDAREAPAATTRIAYASSVARTAIFGGQAVARDLVPDLASVPLRAPLDVLQFDANWLAIRTAYRVARYSGSHAIRRSPVLGSGMARDLFLLRHQALSRINIVENSKGRAKVLHLRAYVLLPLGRHSLRVAHGVGMEDDADDRMTLDQDGDGLAEAFRDSWIAFGDRSMMIAGARMTKYERALLRPSLQTWFAVPIFPDTTWLEKPEPAERGRPLGVLVIDSDADLQPFILDSRFREGDLRFEGGEDQFLEFMLWMCNRAATLARELERA